MKIKVPGDFNNMGWHWTQEREGTASEEFVLL